MEPKKQVSNVAPMSWLTLFGAREVSFYCCDAADLPQRLGLLEEDLKRRALRGPCAKANLPDRQAALQQRPVLGSESVVAMECLRDL